MNRQFSSNTSISLIQWDDCLDSNTRFIRSNSLVEMFDPIFDKVSDTQDNNILQSTSSEDIFAPIEKHQYKPKEDWVYDYDIVDDIFVESFLEPNQNSNKDSIYPSLKSFQDLYSEERYSVFTNVDEPPSHEVNIPNIRPSVFKEIPIESKDKTVLYDVYACKDMERFMKTLTELHMQSLNLLTDERSHLVFDQVFKADFNTETCHSTSRVIIEISDSLYLTIGSPYSADINPFTTSERQLVASVMEKQSLSGTHMGNLFLRIYSRSEYLKQGDFPLIFNQSFFQNYRIENDIRLVLEYIDFTDNRFRLRDDWYLDTSSTIYQMLEKDFHWIPRSLLEEIFSNLNNYRNSVVNQLREYRSPHLDLSSIEASIGVFRDQCRSLCLVSNDLYTVTVSEKVQEINQLTNIMMNAFRSNNDVSITSSVENLIMCLDHSIKLMILFAHQLTVFCNSNFSVRPEKLSKAGLSLSQSGSQSISKLHTNFYLKLGSLCGFHSIIGFSSFYIKATVRVGKQPMLKYLRSRTIPVLDSKASYTAYITKTQPEFHAHIPFNETFTFDNLSMSFFPLETSVMISVMGKRLSVSAENQFIPEEEIAWAEVPLFDTGGMLNQGAMLIGLWTGGKKLKWCLGMNRSKRAPVLQIELPTFHIPVKYSHETQTTPLTLPDNKLSEKDKKDLDEAVERVWMRNISSTITKSCEILWLNRSHLMHHPKKFIALCIAVATGWPEGIECDNKDFLIDYLERCHRNLHSISATELLHLLGPQMHIVRVRKWAVQCLREIGSDGCMSIIPALVEAMKYDTGFNSSGIEEMLFHFSLSNINFSTSLFWQFSSIKRSDYHGYKVRLLLGMLRSVIGNMVADMWNNQLTVVEHLQIAANAVKAAKGTPVARKNIMHNKLEELYDLFAKRNSLIQNGMKVHPLSSFRVPYQPGTSLLKLEMKDCSYFNSFTMPLRIVFRGMDNSMVEVMFKSGDDLRQDILILQLFRLMDDLWISEGLDLRMVHYKVMSTGDRCGLVELVGDCTTLRKIQELRGGIAAPLTNASVVAEWLRSQNTTKSLYNQSVRNFLLTCAACCVSTYLLGIGDRHNDNIMIQTTGRMFHIDFAKILGDAQTIAGIKRDRVPFVLTQDMVYVLEDYVPQDDDRRTGMQLLIDKSCEAFNILRRHWCSLISVLTMAADANIPGVNSTTILYVTKMLRLHDSDIQASEHFTDLIKKCVGSISTPFNFLLHNLAQMKYSSNNEGSLFSFTPKIHSNGPRIVEIVIQSVEKLRSPNKQYIYNIRVSKENSPINIVFRRYEHFVELAQQMASIFPLSILTKISQPVIKAGVPTSIVTAEARRSTLQQFTSVVLSLGDEISQCDHMQTFFHSTLFDENTLDEQSKQWHILSKSDTSTTMSQRPEIQVKFHLSPGDRKLEIFVKHARNLTSSRLEEPPNAYVKTYLLPNYGFSSKRKTSVVMRDCSPSFNDIITYTDLIIRPNTMVEISVWHNETLGENFCLGQVVVPITKSMSTEEQWLQLKHRSQPINQSVPHGRNNASLRKSIPNDWKDLWSVDSSRYV